MRLLSADLLYRITNQSTGWPIKVPDNQSKFTILQNIADVYNDTYHSTIYMTPKENYNLTDEELKKLSDEEIKIDN